MSAEIAAAQIPIPGSTYEAPSDAISFRTARGQLIRLPTYSERNTAILLEEISDFRIAARTIFPLSQPLGQGQVRKPRFEIRVNVGPATLYRRSYCAENVSLTEAVTSARKWIRQRRWQDRVNFVLLPPLLILWAFLRRGRLVASPSHRANKLVASPCHRALCLVLRPREATKTGFSEAWGP